jgi:opacity protein-like surface antigen
MYKRTMLMLALATLVAVPAMAQEKRGEVNLLFGWSFADGVDGNAVTAGDGKIYNRLDPKDGPKWGLSGGAFVGPNGEVGFMFSQLSSKLVAGGNTNTEIGDMTVSNYHGYFGYNFGDPDMPVRMYFFGGAGATTFGSVDYTRINGQPGQFNSATKFTTTWGLGLKLAPSKTVGARFGIQWTPAYIKSDAAGYWCDPYWGCYLVGNAKYANQWDLNGGLSFRF